jgi:2,3-bisphosphoglycerate-independent phosphoglycerate mutase
MTFVLCILDGWGHSDKKEFNAIAQAYTPNFDHLIKNFPHSLLECSGEAVGLPNGQMGNSEVGHITIGSGRIIYQDLPKINKAVESGELSRNLQLLNMIEDFKKSGKTCHLIGLLSDGGVHSHIDHIIALYKIISANGIVVKLHAITDGRDVAPQSAIKYLETLHEHGIQVSTIMGRFYGMDRDKRWDRTEKAFQAIVNAKGEKFTDVNAAVTNSYDAGVNDEFIVPMVDANYNGIQDGDAIVMANFRADRVRQISHAFCDANFKEFTRALPKLSHKISMTEYSDALASMMTSLFTNDTPKNTLGEVIASLGKKQLRAAETEKYAHVTYFFNGGREDPFVGEDRVLMPSPKVATYDLKPEMSAFELTEKLVPAILSRDYAFVCINFANADMVGHSGSVDATVKAIEAVDSCLGKIMDAVKQIGGEMLVTADHGNAEEMMDEKSHQPLTSHTLNKVPLIYFGKEKIKLKNGGLANIAPTILALMKIKKPAEMSENNLII